MTPDVLRGALDAGGVGIWLLDLATGRAQWSDHMAGLHRVGEREGDRTTIYANVLREDRPGVDEAVAHAPSLSEPIIVEYRVETPDGLRWLAATVSSFSDDSAESTLVSALATDVTDRKQHEQSSGRRRARIEGLQWVSQAIIGGQDLDDTAAALVEAAADVLGASAGLLVYVMPDDNGGSLAQAVTGLVGDVLPPERFEWPATIGTGDQVPGEQVIAVDDVHGVDGVAEFLGRMGLPDAEVTSCGSAMLIPIGRESPLGALCLTRDEVGYFTATDAELATAIGSTAAAAIEIAYRNEEQRLAARTFQQHLLPDAPVDVDGVELCTQYHPGRDGLDVGGDWFDVLDLDGRIGLAVGDVCGHGLASAAHMGQLRYSFRALVRSSTPPEQALQVLNDIALELGTTATVAYAELDLETGGCEVWRCGHLPPVIASADDGTPRWLGELSDGGPMLGFVDEVTCDPIHAHLDPGDILLLYTDGLVERRGEVIDDGLDRLATALADSLPIAALDDRCGALYEALAVMGPDSDDIALVAVRRS